MNEKKKILFVCVGNTCRSQMAEGFARHFGDGRVEVRSAGTNAFGRVSTTATGAMSERGIDISDQTSDQITIELIEWADKVVTLGCCSADELCPVTFSGEKIDWSIADPLGGPPELVERVRDEIEERVKRLIDE